MSETVTRCSWATNDRLREYHDYEYGQMTPSDDAIFEKICLESFSAGLSWYVVLTKREALRDAFAGFSIDRCARLSDEALDLVLSNPNVIRNGRKINAVRSNAAACQQIIAEHSSLRDFVTSFSNGRDLAKAMRTYGIRQFGPIGAQELLKSLGLVPAHEPGCFRARHVIPGDEDTGRDADCRHS